MSIDRAAVESHLARVLGELLAVARVVPADVAGGLKEPIDQAFAAAGYGGASDAPLGASEAVLAHAEYRTLLRVHRALLLKPLFAGEEANARRDRTESVRLALEAARLAAEEARNAATAGAGGFGAGSIGLGYVAVREA